MAYGITFRWHATEQRRGAIGLRMALGAQRADVTRMIVSDAIQRRSRVSLSVMRRSTLAFASGLVAASVVATLVAVVRGQAPSASNLVELAPSVLSPTQVVHLFDAYQAMSDDRANSVEQQKKRKAGRSPEDLSWSFPALWSNRIP
jgi:hypothetical protein